MKFKYVVKRVFRTEWNGKIRSDQGLSNSNFKDFVVLFSFVWLIDWSYMYFRYESIISHKNILRQSAGQPLRVCYRKFVQ